MGEKLYYFAYGSNLLIEQMVKRCPESLPLTQGILRDYKLVYKANPSGRGVADVIESKGDKVYGAIYEVTANDLKKLDRYEGRPTVYDRHIIKVETRKGMIKCIVYLMEPQYTFALPQVEYFKKIFNGYGDWILPQKHLTEGYSKFKVEVSKMPKPKISVTKNNTKNNNSSKPNKGKSKNKPNKNSNGKVVYKTRTPIGYEPAIKWV